jgi:sporulation protein YlmC with PRC-barrel domain
MAENIRSFVGHNLMEANGEKIGKIDALFVDAQTGEPEWLVVKTGMLGGARFVPVAEVTAQGEDAVVPFDKTRVKGSPGAMGEGSLSPTEERTLCDYYGIDCPETPSGSEDVGLWSASH